METATCFWRERDGPSPAQQWLTPHNSGPVSEPELQKEGMQTISTINEKQSWKTQPHGHCGESAFWPLIVTVAASPFGTPR